MSKKGGTGGPIFLYNTNILEWERPSRTQRPGTVTITAYDRGVPDGLTEVTDYRGFEVINERINPYHIAASSAFYDARVALLGDKYMENGDERTHHVEEVVLFVGNIALYKDGMIPGTSFEGFDFVCQGKIFTVGKPRKEFHGQGALRHLIFADTKKKKQIERIEAIIHGYETQARARASAQHEGVYQVARLLRSR